MKLMSECLPEGWSRKRIEDLGQLYSGATPSTHINSYWGDEIVWVTPNDLSKLRTRYIAESERQITALGLQNCSAHLLPKGSLIISSRAPIGYLAIAQTDFCTNQGCKSLAFASEQNPDFHYYNLSFRVSAIREKGEGTTFAEISKAALAKIEVPVPDDKAEQTAIADILATVDRAIEQTEALIAKQRRIKAGLLHDLLTRGIDERGNLRDPATHRFKQSPLGLIPEEWGVAKVGDLFSMELGKMLSKASKRNIFPKPYLANKNVQWGRVDISDLDTMDFYPREQIRFRLKKGDILVCEGGEVGRTALWNDELDECHFQKAIHRLRPVNHQITPQFMMYYMQFVIPQGTLLNLTTQTSIAHLTQEQLAISPIVFPDTPEMNWITAILTEHDELIRRREADLEKLHRLKTGLMQDLLSGRVSVAGLVPNVSVKNNHAS